MWNRVVCSIRKEVIWVYYHFLCKLEKKQGILYAVYLSVSSMLLFGPAGCAAWETAEFKRVIGIGVVAGCNVNRLIRNFLCWFALFAVVFVLSLCLVNYFAGMHKTKEQFVICQYLDKIIILADANLVLRCINYFYDRTARDAAFVYADRMLLLILVCGFLYIILKLDRNICAEQYLKMLFCGLMISYPAAVLVLDGALLIAVQIFASSIVVIAAKRYKKEKKSADSFLKSGVLVFCMFPFMTSFYIELVNIMNQYGIFVMHPAKYYGMATVFMLAVSVVLALWIQKRKWKVWWWKRWAYPWMIFGISCLSVQIPLENVYGAHIYETANSSILISDFLNYGLLPIVSHYGGHMMTGVWEGLIYALLNQDYAGAVFSPYEGYILAVLAVLFFWLVKYIWDEDVALWVTLLFPFYSFWNYFGLGMLICIAVLAFIKKNTYVRAGAVWTACAWCALYRLDLGYAYGMACIASLVVYTVVYRKKRMAQMLGVTLMVFVVFCSTIWCALCLFQNINPAMRLYEFLQISQSNLNWAYDNIGNSSNTVFSWCYLFLPFFIDICLLYLIFSGKFRASVGDQKWMLLLIFGFSYFANFARGLVRHSLAEMQTSIVIWTGYIFIAIFVSCYLKKDMLFLPVFLFFMLCNTLFVQDACFREASIADNSVSKMHTVVLTWTQAEDAGEEANGEKTYWERIGLEQRKVQRVQWDASLMEQIIPYQAIIDVLLEENETYVDFMNCTFVYSALNKKNPVYVSQSPLQLSGEYTQEQFIKQVQEDMEHIPLVLMPMDDTNLHAGLDGIANAYRYYKVAEFIYHAYRPLCRCGNTAVWCVQTRYEEMLGKLEGNSMFSPIDWGYDGAEWVQDEAGNKILSYKQQLHHYSIGHLPEIWAEYDTAQAVNNRVVSEWQTDGNIFSAKTTFEKGQRGNYLLLTVDFHAADNDSGQQIENPYATLKLGSLKDRNLDEKFQYIFTLKEGRHKYLFRVSSDYYWYSGDICAAQFVCGLPADAAEIKILEGD